VVPLSKQNVFSDRRNLLYDKSASFACNGSQFHSPGPAAANPLSYSGSFETKSLGLSLTVSEIFNGECDAMVDMTLNDLNKGHGHSFWYQSIPHIRLPIGCQYNFCSRAHRLATIHILSLFLPDTVKLQQVEDS